MQKTKALHLVEAAVSNLSNILIVTKQNTKVAGVNICDCDWKQYRHFYVGTLLVNETLFSLF